LHSAYPIARTAILHSHRPCLVSPSFLHPQQRIPSKQISNQPQTPRIARRNRGRLTKPRAAPPPNPEHRRARFLSARRRRPGQNEWRNRFGTARGARGPGRQRVPGLHGNVASEGRDREQEGVRVVLQLHFTSISRRQAIFFYFVPFLFCPFLWHNLRRDDVMYTDTTRKAGTYVIGATESRVPVMM
jgi:hypothetical protein